MEVKVYNSITEIEETKWDKIVGRNRIICTHRFLEAVEKSNINDCKYFYPVVYDNNKIIAHACAYTISMEFDIFSKGMVKKIIIFIRKFWKNFLTLRFIECGTPVALGNIISFAENINKQLVLSYLINKIENIAKKEKIGIIVLRDFYENETYFFDNLISKRYKKINNLPNTILMVKWNSFNEYLNDLRSHYRYKIIKNIKIAHGKGLTIEVCDKFSNLAEQLQNLWHNVYENAKEYRREILTKEFFINMDTFLEKKSKVILLKKDLKIVGYALLVSDENTLRFMFSGINYDYNTEYFIYFNSLYYIINQAINEEKKEIDLGLTTYVPKMNIGAEVVNLHMYLKHLNILLNPILTNLYKIISPKIKIKTANVFKNKIENKFEKKYLTVHN
jgi:predicted N-acyltransferase